MTRSRPTCFTLWSLFPRALGSLVVIGALFASVALTGCGTALRISHRQAGSSANPASIPGVPFYVKRARCRQEVVWFEPLYTLTLSAMIPDKDGALQSHPRGSLVLSRTGFLTDEVKILMKTVSNGGDEGTVKGNWAKVVPLVDPQILTRDFASLPAGDRVLLGSSAAPAVFVDYADQYYVNAKLPVAGSANVDAKVAADGSLTEASGQVETKTLETILTAATSVTTGALGVAGKTIVPGNVEAFTLTVSISGYRHTLARLVDYPLGTPTNSTPACPVVREISLADASEYKREDLSAPADSSKTDKKADTSGQQKPAKPDKSKDDSSPKDATADDQSANSSKGDNSAAGASGKPSSGTGTGKPKKKKS